MLESIVEMEASPKQMKKRQLEVMKNGNLLDKISWFLIKRERPSKTNYYPLPPRK